MPIGFLAEQLPRRTPCRKNPEHLAEFCHPADADWKEGEAQAASAQAGLALLSGALQLGNSDDEADGCDEQASDDYWARVDDQLANPQLEDCTSAHVYVINDTATITA